MSNVSFSPSPHFLLPLHFSPLVSVLPPPRFTESQSGAQQFRKGSCQGLVVPAAGNPQVAERKLDGNQSNQVASRGGDGACARTGSPAVWDFEGASTLPITSYAACFSASFWAVATAHLRENRVGPGVSFYLSQDANSYPRPSWSEFPN